MRRNALKSAERGNRTPCAHSWQAALLDARKSLAWVGIFTHQSLRRNAIPHQTHVIACTALANEFSIIASIVVDIAPKTKAKSSNPNEIATRTSICTCTSKPVKKSSIKAANVLIKGRR